ncbi:MAG: hypothetical protein JRI97_04125 [Deltaproteobacteria bacterium]|nr:hypothetical protein [Deltaproteobacteria bacterium]
METVLPDLRGKIVVLYLVNRSLDHVAVMEDPHFEMLGNRLFIIGTVPEGTSPNDWAAGVTSNVAWDRVEEYLVFDSLEEYLSRASAAWDETVYQ